MSETMDRVVNTVSPSSLPLSLADTGAGSPVSAAPRDGPPTTMTVPEYRKERGCLYLCLSLLPFPDRVPTPRE